MEQFPQPKRSEQKTSPEKEAGLQQLNLKELNVGDIFYLETASQSEYAFQVKENQSGKIKVQCLSGSEQLKGNFLETISGTIEKDTRFVFTNEQEELRRTSPIEAIRVEKNEAKTKTIPTADLKTGDVIHISTKSGSQYSFKVAYCKDGHAFVEGQQGKLAGSGGPIRGNEIKVGEPFYYGESNHTSAIEDFRIEKAA